MAVGRRGLLKRLGLAGPSASDPRFMTFIPNPTQHVVKNWTKPSDWEVWVFDDSPEGISYVGKLEDLAWKAPE